MKKSIYQAFDEIQNLPQSFENITQDSVYAPIDIDIEKIKRGAFEMTGIKNSQSHTSKKWSAKKWTAVLVAATLAAAVIGTGAAAAGGTFNSVFGQMVAGEPVDGVYAGGHVRVDSDTLNVDFKGVTGDNRQACAMISITKKDGTPFTDDFENTFVQEHFNQTELSCTKPFWEKVANGFYNSQHGEVWYDLTDANTINTMIWYEGGDYSLIGETLSVHSGKVYLYHVKKVLSTWDEFQTSLTAEYDTEDVQLQDNQIRTICDGKMVTLTLNPNETITRYKDKQVLAVYEEMDLSYDLSVQLNYKNCETIFDDVKDKSIPCDGVYKNISRLAVQPYTMQLDLYQSGDFRVLDDEDYHTFQQLNPSDSELDKLTVTTADGQVYYANKWKSTSAGDADGFTESIVYQFTDTDIEKIAVIDPQQILSISYNGKYLYQK